MNLICLKGTDKKLYELLAPLVMNPAILRQNNNYPFKTSHRHVWHIAVDETGVAGFIPLKPTSAGFCIDNYYIRGDDASVTCVLLEQIIDGLRQPSVLTALVHKRHVAAFGRMGFRTRKEWRNYDKMEYSPEER